MASFTISYAELVEIVLSSNREVHKCLDNIKRSYPNLKETVMEKIYEELSRNFLPKFTKRWQAAARNKKTFLNKNQKWLQNTVFITVNPVQPDMIEDETGPSKRSRSGRPEKPFDECCDRTKRYKVKSLYESFPENVITRAADKCNDKSTTSTSFTPEKALALLLDASLSKHQYQIIRNAAKDLGCDIFPSYDKVLDAKKECYPTDIEITESYACIGLQDLLDHTTQRIFKTKTEDELASMGEECVLISKWGCDGSSGHNEYKQTFNEENITDANMFLTSLVPLRLSTKDNDTLVHWKNTCPSSTRYCRPVQFQFSKETTMGTKSEISRMYSEIANLNETVISLNGKTYEVHHQLLFTMIDGKIAQTITDTSSNAVCFICKAKPTEMNDLNKVRSKIEDEDALKVGLAPLHARIKFMECIIHIAYNKSFKTWRTNQTTKPQKEVEKKRIQEEFFKQLGLKVDFVKQGMGTSNDGNTSRRFFNNPAVTAEITGVDENLILRFGIILQIINSGVTIDAEKFDNYCTETAELYVSLYSWYYMPNTVHKVLMHGSKVINAAMLPIGMLTEEAQEARNKDYRHYRLSHSRKCSRESTNEDIINMLLASSDPFISRLRTKLNRKHVPLHEDAQALVVSDN